MIAWILGGGWRVLGGGLSALSVVAGLWWVRAQFAALDETRAQLATVCAPLFDADDEFDLGRVDDCAVRISAQAGAVVRLTEQKNAAQIASAECALQVDGLGIQLFQCWAASAERAADLDKIKRQRQDQEQAFDAERRALAVELERLLRDNDDVADFERLRVPDDLHRWLFSAYEAGVSRGGG